MLRSRLKIEFNQILDSTTNFNGERRKVAFFQLEETNLRIDGDVYISATYIFSEQRMKLELTSASCRLFPLRATDSEDSSRIQYGLSLVALSMASSGRDFDPRTRAFSDEELKPQPMIKKSRKQVSGQISRALILPFLSRRIFCSSLILLHLTCFSFFQFYSFISVEMLLN